MKFLTSIILLVLVLTSACSVNQQPAHDSQVSTSITAYSSSEPTLKTDLTNTPQPATSYNSTPASPAATVPLSPTRASEAIQATQTPTPTPEPAWAKALDAVQGITIMYPSDWVLMPATNNQRWTQILSWTPVGPGGMDGVPIGGLLVRISITSDSVPSNGEPIEVGDKGYAGVLVHGDKTETNPFWNPELVRRVYYQAQDSQWLIEGFFGNEVNDSNPNLPMFLRIVKSIAHVNAPAPRLTPISQPTPTPIPLSPAYLNPRGALCLTFEQHGQTDRQSSDEICGLNRPRHSRECTTWPRPMLGISTQTHPTTAIG